ncbi:MAG: hypothetical protein K2P92_01515 [Bdellovibrionaceae bacterium]|nr:hypothetical protein [Pseudobdellovibrionaceae bacterium]
MVKKLVIILIFILMLVGVAIFFRVEFKYMMVLNGQSTLILGKLKKAVKLPANNITTREDHIAAVADENGVGFATDLSLYNKALFKQCAEACLTKPEFYRAYNKILDQVHVEELWVYAQNKTKDRVASYILDREKNQLLKTLQKSRAQISDGYGTITALDQKQMALDTIKKIDDKIALIKAK